MLASAEGFWSRWASKSLAILIASSFLPKTAADCFVEAVIEVHDRLRPKSVAQFLPGHQFSWFFQQHGQQLEGSFLQPHPFAKLREFTGSKIGFEKPQT